ncbi:hypothetical protein NL676_031344 [Syzygium grande]|nr:hypothetical protein NL676_031344 [Syzygium grande]
MDSEIVSSHPHASGEDSTLRAARPPARATPPEDQRRAAAWVTEGAGRPTPAQARPTPARLAAVIWGRFSPPPSPSEGLGSPTPHEASPSQIQQDAASPSSK